MLRNSWLGDVMVESLLADMRSVLVDMVSLIGGFRFTEDGVLV